MTRGGEPRSAPASLVDASVILAAFDSEDRLHQASRRLLTEADATLATLDLARYEIANVAVRAWRKPDLVAPILEAIERIAEDGGVFSSDSGLLQQGAELAEAHGISVYDATYVAAARRSGFQLVSCDERDLVSRGLALLPASADQPVRA